MHAAIGDEADEVEGVPAVFDAVHRGDEGFVFEQTAVAHPVVYLGHGLHDRAARAQVEMPDFGVAHEAIGQAHGAPGGGEGGVGVIGPQAVHRWGFRKGHGIVVFARV